MSRQGFTAVACGLYLAFSVAHCAADETTGGATRIRSYFVAGTAQMHFDGSAQVDDSYPATTEPKPGQILDTNAVLALMQQRAPTPDKGSLFRGTKLFVRFEDFGATAGTDIPLGDCLHLDLVADGTSLLALKALCDRDAYTLSIARDGIAVLKNGAVEWKYKLKPGVYAINGIPFRVAGAS